MHGNFYKKKPGIIVKKTHMLFFLLSINTYFFAQPTNLEYTLPEAHTEAHENNLDYKTAHEKIGQTERKISQTHGKLLPQFTLHHGTEFSKTSSVNKTTHTLTLSGSQLIYDPAGPQLDSQIFSHEKTIQKLEAEQTKKKLTHELLKIFLQTWLYQEKDQLHHALQNDITRSRESLQNRLSLGILDKLSYQSKQVELSEKNNIIAQNRAIYNKHLSKLKKLLGLEKNLKQNSDKIALFFDPTEEIIFSLKPLSFYLEQAQTHRLDLRAFAYKKKQHEIREKKEKRKYLPSFKVTGNIAKEYNKKPADYSLGLHATWNIFDGFQKSNGAAIVRADQDITTIQEQEKIRAIHAEIESQYMILSRARTEKSHFYRAQHNANQTYQNEMQKYQLGLTSETEIYHAYYQREVARDAYRAAYTRFKIELDKLEFLAGYPERINDA